MINSLIKTKSDCCGCGACSVACPVGCITMQQDSEGFLYPQADETKCINCKKCINACPSLTKPDYNQAQQTYAGFCKNDATRQNSSSGGIFYLLAEYVLQNGGAVCGAAFDDDWSVKHIIVDNIAQLPKLQTSKYLQSKIHAVLTEVKSCLESGRLVLFSGTPCQINALASYLNKDYANLYLVDIICHGAPSPMVWQKYLASKEKDKIQTVNFRDKSYGWAKFATKIDYGSTQYLCRFNDDLYMTLFLRNLILRPSCYSCFSKHPNKLADVTLGDFWGIDNVLPQLNDDKGISAIIINSDKGAELFENVKDNLTFEEVSFEQIEKGNSALSSSVAKPQRRDNCMAELSSKQSINFEKLVKKYTTPTFVSRVKGKIKRMLG